MQLNLLENVPIVEDVVLFNSVGNQEILLGFPIELNFIIVLVKPLVNTVIGNFSHHFLALEIVVSLEQLIWIRI